MPYRNLIIASPASLSIKHAQIVVRTDVSRSVPLEDINAIMLEHPQINMNAYLLNALAEHGICVFICDAKHLPSAILLGFKMHCRKPKMLALQLGLKKPVVKQLWQQIIVRKIENQAKVLELLSNDGCDELRRIARTVSAGDGGNAEAVAAVRYFPALFGAGFTRGSDCGVNAALNYGYAILRGHICRSLVTCGLEPELGLFHHNQLNAFNLADDLIEVFRPCVDVFIALNVEKFEEDLTPQGKHALFNVVNFDVRSGGELHPIHYAIERMVQSYSAVLKAEATTLKLCEVCAPNMHSYE